jgi:dephospho-CoA kinase
MSPPGWTDMRIVGLTGSIGMGKSVAAAILRRQGVWVHDADAAVHALLGKGGAAVEAIRRAFPGVVKHGAVDRVALGKRVFGDTRALRRLEAIVHPLVRAQTDQFIEAAARARRPLVVLDIPLLFEKGGRQCDAVIVVSAPAFLQAQRVLRRPGMSPKRLSEILARQMPDQEKRRRADAVVLSGLGKGETFRQLAGVRRRLRRRPGRVWSPHYGKKR